MSAIRVRTLTARECAVVRALGRDTPMKIIAADMSVSINTVGTWAKRAYRKLGVASRRDAVRRHAHLPDHVCAADVTHAPGPR